MKKLSLMIVLLLLPSWLHAICGGSSPNLTAADPTYAEVAACVAASTYGDTITVPAGDGTETWATQLAIVKGVNLIGPGAGNLTITNSQAGYVIKYTPDAESLTNNQAFGVSGFTFSTPKGVWLYSRSTTVSSKIRIYDNVFTDLTAQFLKVDTTFGGVVHDNTVTTSGDVLIEFGGMGMAAWNAFAWTPALTTALYVEDNTFTVTKAAPQPIASSDGAYPYVIRYNTINHTGDGNISALFDIHGNQGTGNVYAALGAEFYGNNLIKTYTGRTTEHLYHRGGSALYFFNKTNGTATEYIQNLEMVIDSLNVTTPGSYPSGTSQINGQPQKVSNSYYWNNRGANAVVTYTLNEWCGTSNTDFAPCDPAGSVLAADREFWRYVASGFDGTTGVGCGTLAQMNAITPTLTGAGFWVTTQGNCADLTGYVGASPATPISGTLYKWSGAAWVSYYTPYTYPHPLIPASEYIGVVTLGGTGSFSIGGSGSLTLGN